MTTAVKLSELINGNSSQIVVPSGGVNFGTSTGGSGTVSTDGGILDDYEEGSWPVTWNNLTGTPNNTTGYYVKIGITVFINYNSGTGTISGTGNQVRFNLPFVPDKNAAGSMIRDGVDFGGEILFFTDGKCYPLTFNHEQLNFSGTYLVA